MDYELQKIIETRKSIRVYDNRPLSNQDLSLIKEYIAKLEKEDTPFPSEMKIHLVEAKKGTNVEKLGTYGIIKGTKTFLCITSENKDEAMESIGYNFEKLVLYLTSIGIGTCWLAGTFNREQFLNSVPMKNGEIFPIVCPIGYPLDKNTFLGSIFRIVSKSNQRKNWEELFFENDFSTPLTKQKAGPYAYPLEMLRLAPSAANKQPWRVVYKNNYFHFYRLGNPKSKYPYDLQRLDVGIGASHFHLASIETKLKGEFVRLSSLNIDTPENIKYLFSYRID